MIHFTTRYDPETDLWQFLVQTKSGPRWSRPMDHKEMASYGKEHYHKRMAEGRAAQQAENFRASSIPVAELLATGAFAVTKLPTTSPELLASQRRRERQELRALPIDDLMSRLGLDNPVIPNA